MPIYHCICEKCYKSQDRIMKIGDRGTTCNVPGCGGNALRINNPRRNRIAFGRLAEGSTGAGAKMHTR